MAGVDISFDFTGLKEQIKQIAVQRLSGAAKKIADELTQFSEQTIQSFYNHYQPIKYKRQGGLSGTYSRLYKNAHGNIFYGGVDLHPGTGSYFGYGGKVAVSADWPSALAVFSGKHGYVESFPHVIHNVPPVMKPAPYDLILKKRDEIANNIDSYINP